MKNPRSGKPRRLDVRVTITDPSLIGYITTHRLLYEREVGQQIIYMLKFAAAQMSAHDQQPPRQIAEKAHV